MSKKRQNIETASPSNLPNKRPASESAMKTADDKPLTLKDQTSLRYISKRVSKIVERKQTTNYNEVANELVAEASDLLDREEKSMPSKERKNHEKNIRRRVYDALNVLLATNIITKTKDKDNKEKVIHWKGFPASSRNDLIILENEKEEVMKEVERKKQCLQELLIQNVCFFNLNRRNTSLEDKSSSQDASSKDDSDPYQKRNGNKSKDNPNSDDKIPLPFIVVNASEKAVIQCEMNREKTDVMFNFNMPFEINDDNEILKRLGL